MRFGYPTVHTKERNSHSPIQPGQGKQFQSYIYTVNNPHRYVKRCKKLEYKPFTSQPAAPNSKLANLLKNRGEIEKEGIENRYKREIS